MTAKILLILVLLATIIPVCLLFGIPASKYNKKVQKKEKREDQQRIQRWIWSRSFLFAVFS